MRSILEDRMIHFGSHMRMQQSQKWRSLLRTRCALACGWGFVAISLSFHVHAADCDGNRTLITLPPIAIASDAPIGTVLWSQKGIPFNSYCYMPTLLHTRQIYLWRADLSSALRKYGLTFWLVYAGNGGNTPSQIKNPIVLDIPWNQSSGYASGVVDLELRKISDTPEAGSLVGVADVTAFYLDGNTNYQKGAQYIRGLRDISFISYTCDIDTGSRDMTVPLGKVRVDRFSGYGSTLAEQSFNLNLSCSQPAGAYTVAVTFSAMADSSRAPGVLALAPGPNTAAGVGIQLLKDGSPVAFERELAVGSATGSVALAIPMTVRYYQTGHTVVPGEANGIATFVLTYK
ncbi:fimbrial protein [Stenotrophomonas sp. LARHCG68]